MLFNSYIFILFFCAVYILYLVVPRRSQNLLILISSYIFYGWWDWRFLLLIATSSLVDYASGLMVDSSEDVKKKKMWLVLSLSTNLLFLAFFKYFNFFIDSINDAFNVLGTPWNLETFKIILPVGISFYTFQSMSYTIDIFQGRIKPTKNVIAFMAYVSFFPQLVAGPIERASNLLPQFLNKRKLESEKLVEGCRLILWGYFQKVVIADNLAPIVEQAYEGSQVSGLSFLVAAYAFTLQIYGDFAGYSNIARGCAKLFGFDLMVNFNAPYVATSIKEFWKRWHISLSSWFRDYVYLPLGGNRGTKWKFLRNIFITFLLSGLWHGANWTFLAWGFIHAIFYLIFPFIFSDSKKVKGFQFLKWFVTFHVVVLAYIFFRSSTIGQAQEIVLAIFDSFPFLDDSVVLENVYITFILGLSVFITDKLMKGVNLKTKERNFVPLWLVDYLFLIGIITLGRYFNEAFIYFQF